METVIAALLGVISGLLAFAPLAFTLKLARHVTKTSNFGNAGILLLSVLISLLILMGTAILCIILARDMVLPFVIAEVLGLTVSAIAFGVYKLVRK